MLANYRLKKRGSFTYIYNKGLSFSNKFMVVFYVPAHNHRLGVSVNKKVGKAVIRNKIKRRINESFMRIAPFLEKKCNFVIIAKEECARASFSEIARNMSLLLKKADLLKKDFDYLDVLDSKR